jgi:hypothetical protein
MGPGKGEQSNTQMRNDDISRRQMEFAQPAIEQLGQHAKSLMAGGGISTYNPMIEMMKSNLQSGYSRARQSTMDSLGRGRMAGTPFGQRILADQAFQGETAVANVAPNFYQWFLPMALNTLTGNANIGMQGMNASTGAEAARINANTAATTQYNTAMMQTAGQMASQMMPSFAFTGKI